MRKYLLVVSSVLIPIILMGCSSKPKFTGCVGNNNCRPQEMNFTSSMTGNSAFTMSKIDIQANDMVWDPTSQQIYLSVISGNGTNGNTITTLDPSTGQFGISQSASSDPDHRLALSSDGSSLYAGIEADALAGGYVHDVMVPDGTLNMAYFIGQTSNDVGMQQYTLEASDLTHFNVLGAVAIPNVVGTPVKLIRWGANGLAFLTQTGNASTGITAPAQGDGVYLISGPFVTNPAAQARVASLSR